MLATPVKSGKRACNTLEGFFRKRNGRPKGARLTWWPKAQLGYTSSEPVPLNNLPLKTPLFSVGANNNPLCAPVSLIIQLKGPRKSRLPNLEPRGRQFPCVCSGKIPQGPNLVKGE